MADLLPKLGQTVETQDGRQGIVRYIGELHIAAGNWLGLELPDASGKNDGSVKGERYFQCQPGYGIFVRKESMVRILKQPTASVAPKTNGTANAPISGARPRPSSGVSADAARKRQSLMSNGSGSAVGSRLSMRSPTKSPSKPSNVSKTSTNTSRSGAPATAARPSDTAHKSRLSMNAKPLTGAQNSTTRTSAHGARPSLGSGSVSRGPTTVRASPVSAKSSISTTKPSSHLRAASRPEKTSTEKSVQSKPESESLRSPVIDEEQGNDGDGSENEMTEEVTGRATKGPLIQQPHPDQEPLSPTGSKAARVVNAARKASISNAESRAAQQRETEQLRARIRTLEKNREEDQDKLKQVESLRSDRDRFENIIQALQKKLRTNQQELSDLRKRCEEAETRANTVPERLPEHESEIELATLDKEMAEERAENYQLELETLKTKHEELELEVEILREENKELASTMSPEEKANAGWLQMERERERLRDALVMLRDMTQQNEGDLKAEISELRENLDEVEKTAGLYIETAEKLTRAEENNKHLMEQLEAVDTNDEVVEAMEVQREQHLKSIGQLKHQIQDLEEHIQVTDELENFHVEEEKRLLAQLDESEALLNESHRQNLEQDRVIEDLEYTLTKFRNVVQGLQSDIDELRRSRDISELQANEMSSKSRAMMDLNLRLQSNAAKSQAKLIDTELNNVKADLATKHADILSLFTMESFDAEKGSVMALLCFRRVKSKAKLVSRLLGERLRERSHLSSGEEIFRMFETMERMSWIFGVCHRFERFMDSCSTAEFAAYSNALVEVEPVERVISAWIEALRRDELVKDPPEQLKRMQGILLDLSEKLISESFESKAVEMVVQMEMAEAHAEALAAQLATVTKLVQAKLGAPKSEDEESLVFDKRMDQLTTRARTIKYLSGKVAQQLHGVYDSSLCLDETAWPLFEEVEQESEALTRQVRSLGLAIAEETSKLDVDEPLTYSSIPEVMTSALQHLLTTHGHDDNSDDAFMFLTAHLASLQSFVDDLQNRSSDLNNAVEFSSGPAPWTIRAKEIKNAKVIAPETQEELSRLERRNAELGSKIAERERTIEEMGMRVEIAEKRFKEGRERDNKDKALNEELDQLRTEKEKNETALSDLRAELAAVLENAENDKAELETLRRSNLGSGDGPEIGAAVTLTGATTKADESTMKQFELEANLLEAEINSLQAAVRYLREENRNLRVPISEVLINSARNSWLDTQNLVNRPSRKEFQINTLSTRPSTLEREGIDIWTDLIDIAKTIKPIRLSSQRTSTPLAPLSHSESPTQQQKPVTSWQPRSRSIRYTVLKQREEIAQWETRWEDFITRAKLATSSLSPSHNSDPSTKRNHTRPSRRGPKLFDNDHMNGKDVSVDDEQGVKIVESE